MKVDGMKVQGMRAVVLVAALMGGTAIAAPAPASPAPASPAPASPAPATAPAPAAEAPKADAPKAEAPKKAEVDPADRVRQAGIEKARQEAEVAAATPVLSYTVKTIDDKDLALSEYKGKVLLIVNTASRCGFTYQYKGLEELYQTYKDRGLVVLAFPSNDFGGQEPGKNEDIKEFCTGEQSKYKITFPLFAKISVVGENQHPLFKTLASQPAPIGGDPKWNFTKFLVGRDGTVRERFDSRIRPDDQEFLRTLNDLLEAPVPEASIPVAAPAPDAPAAHPAGETQAAPK